jgi:citrate synthase
MGKILFEIKEEDLDTGMRKFPVGYCVTSYVDPHKGLHYCGIPVSELASRRPQEVIYLLYKGKEGTESERAAFSSTLKEKCVVPKEVVEQIYQLPRKGHPMKLFSSALLLLEMHQQGGDYEADCINVIAKLPHLVACLINHHAGWGKTPLPNFEIGYMKAFAQMLQVPEKQQGFEEALRLFNILHYDHGGGNLSAFVGKAVASGLENLLGSLSAAMCALAGPRHGSANQVTLEFVQQIYDEAGEGADARKIEKLIRHRLENHQLVHGFGHAVLRDEDPRATIFYDFVKKEYPEHPLVKIALLLREVGPKVLKENPKISNPYPNIDAISGTLLTAAGFPYPEYYTVLFGLSRCVGIAIQILYERKQARGGKGTPIIRPTYLYKDRS